MIDPSVCALPTTCFTPDLLNFVFPILVYLVTEVAKRLHRDKMFVWKCVCVIGTLGFCVFLWNPMEPWYIQIPAKGAMVVGFSAGLWHLIKKWSGQEAAEKAACIDKGKAIALAEGLDNSVEIKVKHFTPKPELEQPEQVEQ